ncbi:MAG: post-COAP-1 domain-containing protein [Gemmatimonadales bacterium]
MRYRHRFLMSAVPAALILGACSDDPAAPADVSEADLHVISAKCDFVTGGGSVVHSGRVTFGLHAGRSRGGTVFGRLTVVDHRNKTRYQSTRITAYGRPAAPFFVSVPGSGVTRVFEGTVRVNGRAVRNFTAYVNDSGEPGRGVDRIFFRVAGTEVISGPPSGGLPTLRTLSGGNLQFHNHCIPGNPQSGK